MAKKNNGNLSIRTDKEKLAYAAQPFFSVFTRQQAMIWIGVWDFNWSNKRIAHALEIKDKTVRSVLHEVRKIVADNPQIAYTTIDVEERMIFK